MNSRSVDYFNMATPHRIMGFFSDLLRNFMALTWENQANNEIRIIWAFMWIPADLAFMLCFV